LGLKVLEQLQVIKSLDITLLRDLGLLADSASIVETIEEADDASSKKKKRRTLQLGPISEGDTGEKKKS